MKLYSQLHWTLVYDQEELKKIDRLKHPDLWALKAKQVFNEEFDLAIERGKFLIDNNLLDTWKQGFFYGF